MRCPKLHELPEPPRGKTGWPWTEGSRQLPETMPDGRPWPTVTVVTPSFNQGQFIEETIRSVLLQGYPNLEYFVLDGGSTDNSVEIIKKYAPWLTYWVSEPDGGQSSAINRGLNMGSGLFATWINSDDLLYKDALVEHASRVGFAPNTVYVGRCAYMDAAGTVVATHRGRVHSLEDLLRIRTVWRSGGSIDQPAVLFPLPLALTVGGLDVDNHRTMDYELWGKFFLAGATFRYTDVLFGVFRRQPDQKTSDGLQTTQSMIETAVKLVRLAPYSEEIKDEILADLAAYHEAYKESAWRNSGRLARIGLPRSVVVQLRRLKAGLLQKITKNFSRSPAQGA
jgi:glycosyltransferase involved in cell wall biosynthesis